jgi:hypothetical protein
MKHLLTSLLTLISLTCLAQPTYIDLTIQLDNYPGETSWEIIKTQDSTLVISSPNYDSVPPGSLIEQRIFLGAGIDYTFTITDNFGDGICCGFGDGFFLSANNCEGVIFEDYEFDTSSVSYDFNLIPCDLPPTDITFRVNLANAPPEVETPGVLGNWNGWQVIPMIHDEGDEWFVTIPITEGNYLWKFADFNNPDIQELPVGIDGNSCFLFDGGGFVNRTLTVVEGEEQLLPNYCWESCLPCGAIPGCSDPSAVNWNPWANYDDGSCISQNTDCAPGESTLEIVVTPDNFGGETSWILYGPDDQIYASAPPGTYAGSPPGVPISTTVCVTTGGEYDVVIEDTYGDGLCGTCFGGTVNGDVKILDCDGEVLWNLIDEFEDGNFGYVITSATVSPSTSCGLIEVIAGCTDPAYVEYNPEATTFLAGSCVTPVVVGCTDSTQFNYNPEANTEEIIESCELTLTIKDGVGDGWFGSWLGIYQLGTIFNSPQYQMGPNDGTELSFNISGLDATQPAYIYFFVTPQSIGTAQQCGFTLTNSNGDVIIDVPFFNIIPFINESGWYVYEVTPYCGNTCEPYIYGCTSPEAINYNNEANSDDESCVYSPGCTNPSYVEYSEEADLDDGSCLTLVVFGCTDPDAFNFEEEANVDNGTCIPKVFGCTNELAFNYDPLANTPDGSCIAVEEGCTNPEALNYNPEANTEDFSCILPILGCTDPDAFNFNVLANTDDGTCVDVIFGCTDITAFNYDPLANTNVGCESIVQGCTDITAFNYNPNANVEDGSCEPIVFGCTDEFAFNYDPLANTNVGCESIVEGCTDEEAINYDSQANTDNGSCIAEIFGCTDPTAFNYDENANTDNGSCVEIVFGCMDETALNFNPDANTSNDNCIEVIEGCTDPLALNYNELANVEDGSCIDAIYGCTDPTAFNYNELANVDNGSCEEIIEGCMDPLALNFDPLANVNNFDCIEAIYGCTDSLAFNYNELANVDNGSCIEVIEGCTDPTAFNYNPEANTEDFSCEPFIYGCTDPQAANYDEEANTDNGTCETVYANCIDSVVETYNLLELESECFAWVIDVSPSCCNNEWADGCQTIYNYCDENTVTNIEEFGETQIIVFPNPTRDHINIASTLRINAVLYNSIGQPVLQETNVNQLDLSQFEAGIYNLILTYNDLKFTKKIVKQ